MTTQSICLNNAAAMRRRAWGRLFGAGIAEARRKAGLSIEEAAAASGMEADEWLAIEAGHVPSDPDWDQNRLLTMADAMRVPRDGLVLYAWMCREPWQS